MIGKYEIEVYNNRVHYFLTVKRNITVIQGNSATGKTELIRLIDEHNTNGASSGITVKCDAECVVLNSSDWKVRLSAMNGNIIFIDENAVFLKTAEFAQAVRGSDNYFVIVTRDDLHQLPYSVDEIYGLKNVSDSAKYKSFQKTYNEMYKLYNLGTQTKISPDIIITEDSNSGFECFDIIYQGRCVSAGGKSNVYKMLRDQKSETKLIIVDGAAFGSEMGKVYRYMSEFDKSSILFAPESFEWIILKSGLINVPNAITDETFMHADSKDYMSWEEYYTACLTEMTRNTILQYSKSRLGDAYKTAGSIKKIAGVLPDQIRPEERGV